MTRKEALEMLITKIIEEDEPLFILRGRDPLAAIVVLRWVHEAKESGVNQEKIKKAEDVVLEMLSYPNKKLPD